jgi:hypothetical protein
MNLQLEHFLTTSRLVTGVTVTKENMSDIEDWCGGDIEEMRVSGEKIRYINLKVLSTVHKDHYERAFVGDLVILDDNLFSIVSKELSPKTLVSSAGAKGEGKDRATHNLIVALVKSAMEYQDGITQRGGELSEGFPAAEFVANQVLKLLQ